MLFLVPYQTELLKVNQGYQIENQVCNQSPI